MTERELGLLIKQFKRVAVRNDSVHQGDERLIAIGLLPTRMTASGC